MAHVLDAGSAYLTISKTSENLNKGVRTMITISGKLDIFIAERSDVENLKVLDEAPFVFGTGIVAGVFGRNEDVNGKAFVCYNVSWCSGFRHSTMSSTMKEGEIVNGFLVEVHYDKIQLREIEKLGEFILTIPEFSMKAAKRMAAKYSKHFYIYQNADNKYPVTSDYPPSHGVGLEDFVQISPDGKIIID